MSPPTNKWGVQKNRTSFLRGKCSRHHNSVLRQ